MFISPKLETYLPLCPTDTVGLCHGALCSHQGKYGPDGMAAEVVSVLPRPSVLLIMVKTALTAIRLEMISRTPFRVTSEVIHLVQAFYLSS